MLSTIRSQVSRRSSARVNNLRRWLATEVTTDVDELTAEQQRQRYEEFLAEKEKEPPTRPQLKVPVNPDHGLYAFFRKVPTDGGMSTMYETVESANKPSTKMGRSWKSYELRRKSFKDLHTLWYIVLRERNLLATQAAEGRRQGIFESYLDIREKDARCRKTIARIKQVLMERKLAYEEAHTIVNSNHPEKEAS